MLGGVVGVISRRRLQRCLLEQKEGFSLWKKGITMIGVPKKVVSTTKSALVHVSNESIFKIK
jgi:hypothetical protein